MPVIGRNHATAERSGFDQRYAQLAGQSNSAVWPYFTLTRFELLRASTVNTREVLVLNERWQNRRCIPMNPSGDALLFQNPRWWAYEVHDVRQ